LAPFFKELRLLTFFLATLSIKKLAWLKGCFLLCHFLPSMTMNLTQKTLLLPATISSHFPFYFQLQFHIRIWLDYRKVEIARDEFGITSYIGKNWCWCRIWFLAWGPGGGWFRTIQKTLLAGSEYGSVESTAQMYCASGFFRSTLSKPIEIAEKRSRIGLLGWNSKRVLEGAMLLECNDFALATFPEGKFCSNRFSGYHQRDGSPLVHSLTGTKCLEADQAIYSKSFRHK